MEKKYYTEEEKKKAHREAALRNYYKHKEEKLEKVKEYYQTNKETIFSKHSEYNKTQYGRALYLANAYKRLDKKANRGECTLTAKWIVDNIFSKSCVYDGESDWTKLGCDRIDNSKPHTPDNVVPCCYNCNCKKHTTSYNDYINNIKI